MPKRNDFLQSLYRPSGGVSRLAQEAGRLSRVERGRSRLNPRDTGEVKRLVRNALPHRVLDNSTVTINVTLK